MKITSKNKLLVVFSAISLTDIVLLLLIFFLLSSSFVVQSGIKVNLPASVTRDVSVDDLMVISLTRSGEIYLAGDVTTSFQELGIHLAPRLQSNPDQRILLQADKDVPLEWVIKTMDIIKTAGGKSITIATRQEKIDEN
ncbi:MAG: biopolymer transporter ExbD [Candidatus Delongbacteria bacterium]|nr:biopolymer transporter ExbD [Candidatus Delongbacteria bacterium]